MAVVEVSVVPLGTGSASISSYVARCVELLEAEEGLRYQVTPMGTVIEGDLDRILAVVRRMHEVPFREGAARVLTTLRIDERRDRPLTMEGKVAAVKEKLGR
ncbi:MTH1187 family thiamine-binding protein [Desulfovirgula thermocuniculi]|uniref:MTH1187 family thiamine-binding protein n=1 Tax=Desulfovirgula thermocuniculi TaxID=348842 RepID=UPI0004849560|nr:MTH1187 family thiamine-binding protein [Desulfovirgula thermocuniculi]